VSTLLTKDAKLETKEKPLSEEQHTIFSFKIEIQQ
jgi:hypothetical protein